LEETPHLEPGGDPEKLIKELKAREGAVSSVLLVGHEPYLSELASVLISGGENSAITLKKGAFCKLVARSLTYGRCATLEFLLSPGQVRRLR
jgi:phosphohistidine phosphatase SixA